MRFIYLIFTIILSASVFGANYVEQTDWIGGPGVPGPVLSWDEYFDMSTCIDWYSIPGELLLQETTIMNSGRYPKEYETIGTLISSILEMPAGMKDESFWGNLFWDAGLPAGTEVSFRVRGSVDT